MNAAPGINLDYRIFKRRTMRRPDDYTTLDLIGFGFLETWDRLDRIERTLHRILKQGAQIMAGQDDIDAAVATLGVDTQALNDSAARIEAQLAALEGQGVDTGPLRDALAALDTAVGSVGAIVPATP
jgi:hypothetical protein